MAQWSLHSLDPGSNPGGDNNLSTWVWMFSGPIQPRNDNLSMEVLSIATCPQQLQKRWIIIRFGFTGKNPTML